jgi:hypothetical protein
MLAIETLGAQSSEEQRGGVDPDKFWATLDPLLQEKGIAPLDHIQSVVDRWSGEIEDMPKFAFDPGKGLNSPLLDTHDLLVNVLSNRRPFSKDVARAIFPFWREQLEDARDFLEGR